MNPLSKCYLATILRPYGHSPHPESCTKQLEHVCFGLIWFLVALRLGNIECHMTLDVARTSNSNNQLPRHGLICDLWPSALMVLYSVAPQHGYKWPDIRLVPDIWLSHIILTLSHRTCHCSVLINPCARLDGDGCQFCKSESRSHHACTENKNGNRGGSHFEEIHLFALWNRTINECVQVYSITPIGLKIFQRPHN